MNKVNVRKLSTSDLLLLKKQVTAELKMRERRNTLRKEQELLKEVGDFIKSFSEADITIKEGVNLFNEIDPHFYCDCSCRTTTAEPEYQSSVIVIK